MLLYNSMTDKKEEFKPIGDTVKIYACGPTVYNYFHIGNGRAFMVYDVLRRYLEFIGYKVDYVQNFTDIDDKMINRANAEGITVKELADRFINEYYTDADGLNIKRATYNPKATENIDSIISLIETLIKKGHAYENNGSVYFRVRSFAEYGKLFKQSIEDLESGARISVDETKEDKLDFALWKATKPGEPYWESPWGKGRPGWHIECSAMAKKYLGDTIDIHCGGKDLKFPHHENEIAQSECANGCTFSNFWFHIGFVNINNEKMSKSKNNFFTVRDLSQIYGYEPLRYFAVSSHYRMPLNYEPGIIEQSKASLERLYNCGENINFMLKNATEENLFEDETEAVASIKSFRERFIAAMDDDLNTANAISVIFDLVKEINRALAEKQHSIEFLNIAKKELVDLCDVLGLLWNLDKKESDSKEIDDLVQERQEARKAKNYKRADEIREILKEKGIVIEDTPSGPKWKRV